MTEWNYRIVKEEYGNEGEVQLTIRGVQYDDRGVPISVTEEDVSPFGEDLAGLTENFEVYKKAFDLPVLSFPDDFKGEERSIN